MKVWSNTSQYAVFSASCKANFGKFQHFQLTEIIFNINSYLILIKFTISLSEFPRSCVFLMIFVCKYLSMFFTQSYFSNICQQSVKKINRRSFQIDTLIHKSLTCTLAAHSLVDPQLGLRQTCNLLPRNEKDSQLTQIVGLQLATCSLATRYSLAHTSQLVIGWLAFQ